MEFAQPFVLVWLEVLVSGATEVDLVWRVGVYS